MIEQPSAEHSTHEFMLRRWTLMDEEHLSPQAYADPRADVRFLLDLLDVARAQRDAAELQHQQWRQRAHELIRAEAEREIAVANLA